VKASGTPNKFHILYLTDVLTAPRAVKSAPLIHNSKFLIQNFPTLHPFVTRDVLQVSGFSFSGFQVSGFRFQVSSFRFPLIDGGYVASALGYGIHTQGDTLEGVLEKLDL